MNQAFSEKQFQPIPASYWNMVLYDACIAKSLGFFFLVILGEFINWCCGFFDVDDCWFEVDSTLMSKS